MPCSNATLGSQAAPKIITGYDYYQIFKSSIMLLDNEKLKHWKVENKFNRMFTFEQEDC